MKATVKYNDGKTEKAIETDPVNVTTSTSVPVNVTFKFPKEKLNQLPAGPHDIDIVNIS